MTAKFKVGKASKEDYEKFLKKADEFCEMMRQSLNKEKWNAAGLNAVHTGISANDAVLTFYFGLRSRIVGKKCRKIFSLGEIPFAIILDFIFILDFVLQQLLNFHISLTIYMIS